MLPRGKSLNVGMAVKQGRAISGRPGTLTGGTGGRVAELDCPPDTFQSTFSAAARGLCWVLFHTCLWGRAVREQHLVRWARMTCVWPMPGCLMSVLTCSSRWRERGLGVPLSLWFRGCFYAALWMRELSSKRRVLASSTTTSTQRDVVNSQTC